MTTEQAAEKEDMESDPLKPNVPSHKFFKMRSPIVCPNCQQLQADRNLAEAEILDLRTQRNDLQSQLDAANQRIRAEKDCRIKYQDRVYAICNFLDVAFGKSVRTNNATLEKDVVAGVSELKQQLDAAREEIHKLHMSLADKYPDARAHELILELRQRAEDAERKFAAIKSEQGTHECGCEVCSTISKLCPATSSSYALTIIELRTALAAQTERVGRMEGLSKYARHNARCAQLAQWGPCDCGLNEAKSALDGGKEGG